MENQLVFDQQVADRVNVPAWQVKNTLQLITDGNTIPFIARYRKEKTGSLDETILRQIQSEHVLLVELQLRKKFILDTITNQGKLTPQLESRIKKCLDPALLEDLYLPYKKKRKTRASKAKELGLEELAEAIIAQNGEPLQKLVRKYTPTDFPDDGDALQGASDILAEKIAEDPWVRRKIRNDFERHALIHSRVIRAKEKEGSKYKDYFDHQEKLSRCPSHRYLALLRGEEDGILRISLSIDQERSLTPIYRRVIRQRSPVYSFLKEVIDDAFKRLLSPSIQNEVRNIYKEKADQTAIKVFAKNLKQLLLAPPLGQRSTLAIDPGFRTGCKVAVLNQQGDCLHHCTIYPNPPQNQLQESQNKLRDLVDLYEISAIAVGNGTAGRETENFVRSISFDRPVDIFIVNESGASIYSASEVAIEEFPNLDVTVRGAISIGRRLMDPLAELVKIDPKSIGVGQYQHDVNQKMLQEELDQTVESCVNSVGVNLNTASKHLLKYIAGLGEGLAQNLVAYRQANGAFKDLLEIKKVARLGERAFEQCAGFLRIRNGVNPLDNTGVHPESYHIVKRMAQQEQLTIEDLIQEKDILKNIELDNFVTTEIGIPTLKDIIHELSKPGLDPRGVAKAFSFDPHVKTMEDIHPGMVLPGIVTNLTNFGAFVDFGIKENGLIHISRMGAVRISDPTEVLKLSQEVSVKVLEVDINRKRISLQLI